MNKLISLLPAIFLAGCSVVGIRTAEEPNYQVLHDYGHIQIRHYPSLLIAETEVNADYDNSSNQAFKLLAGYIFGKNKKQQKMSMTTPVLQQPQVETMEMTAPVIQQKTGSVWRMAFVLPEGYALSTVPEPLDPAILIKEIPDKKIAVMKYSGNLTEQGIAERSDELKSWLINKGYQHLSPPRSAAYDPPWTLPFFRRNEIHIDIDLK